MPKNFAKYLFSLCVLFVFCNTLIGQITASVTEGCSPLSSVQFSTSYPNLTAIIWDFDDGGGAAINDPEHTFVEPGTYTVTFSALSNGQQVNDEIDITVYVNPTASLTAPEFGCTNEELSFISTSTTVGGALTNWEWTFGDGNFTNGEEFPVHAYASAGTYDVGLIVTDENGCTGAIIENDIITIAESPDLSVSSSPGTFACETPFEVTFTPVASSNVPGSSGLTYDWTLPIGTALEGAVPQNLTFTEEGIFPVILTVTDDIGCSTTFTDQVTILDPQAAFSIAGGEDGIICPTAFITNESGILPAFFNFGTGNQVETMFNFEEQLIPGSIYDISMTVGQGECVSTITQSYTVEDPEFDLAGTPSLLCSIPNDIALEIVGNSPIDSVFWSYNQFVDTVITDNGTYTAEIFYEDTITYQINGFLPLAINASIITSQGCFTNAFVVDTLWQPNALPIADTISGCAPLTVLFSDSSASYFTQPLVDYDWTINGESFLNTDGVPFSYTFNEPGVYTAQLIVENSAGCIDTSYVDSIYVGEPLPIDFSFSPNPFCINDSVTFTELSQNANIDFFNWNGDNNSLDGCFLDGTQTVVFNQVPGVQTVELTALYNGCPSTVAQEIEVQGAVGRMSFECNCDTPMEYVFNAEVAGGSSWDWDFGDGTTDLGSTETQAIHTYTESGDYQAVLTTYSADGCPPFVDTLEVKVRNLSGFIIPTDTLLCADQFYSFQAIAVDNLETCYRGYHAFWGDGTPPNTNETGMFVHEYEIGGDFEVQVAILDVNGCRDTLRQEVKVFDVEVEATSDVSAGCLPLAVNFDATITSDTTVTDTFWFFGDGFVGGTEDPFHEYNFPVALDTLDQLTNWTAQFIAVTELGCADTVEVEILPIVPIAAIVSTTDATLCVGDEASFFATPDNPDWQYNWEIGALSVDEFSPTVTFNEAGVFDVQLTVRDTNGCPGIYQELAYVNVQSYPDAAITSTADELDALCYPLQATFNNASNYFGDSPGTIVWDLDSGSPIAPNNTVGFTYDAPGTYEVSMLVSTSNGCSDIALDTLIVVGPIAQINTDLNTICLGDEVTFNISDTTDVWTWQWDFGDGQIQEGVDFDTGDEFPEVSHSYNFIPASGQVTASLTVWSLDSVCSFSYQDVIEIYEVIAGFEINGIVGDVEHCDDVFDGLNNASLNADIFDWNLGVLGSSSAETPNVLDFPPGEHEVFLTVESSEFGCTDTISRNITIYPLPEVTTEGGFICAGDQLELTAEGAVTYSWTPPENLSSPNSSSTAASPPFSTTYTVVGTDTNQCSNSALAEVIVFQPLPDFELDSTIIIGETIALNLPPGDVGYNYLWEPEDWVDCITCPNVVLQPLEDIDYIVYVSDTLGCFENEYYVSIEVLPLSSVAVPDVFTPNGDFINDIIYVEGWGIKNLLTFEIYNRWGEMVYQSSDINEGWDGRYKGEIQNMDTYSYIVKVETFIDPGPLELYGMIMLKR
ncbi:MAG: PKD domain-containing protein [Flavobacteriales bacterium]